MPFNGLGTYTLIYDWTQDAANGINISSSRMEGQDTDMATAFNNCLTRDGQGIPTANIPWGNFDLTGVGNFTAATATFSGAVTFSGGLANTTTILDAGSTARSIGFLDMPLTAGTAGRVIVLTDRGFAIPATGNMTIPTNATTAFPIGSTIGIYNNSGSAITIAAVTPGTTTLRLGGSATTGTRTLAQRGFVTLWKVATDEWVALNGGLT